MSYRNVFFELVLLFITFSSFSQTKQYQYYFDNELNSTKPEKSIFYGIGLYKDSVVELKIYKTFNKTLAFIEHFADSSLQLRNGLYQSFYADSSMESAGNYKQGKEDGVWKVWDSVGHVIDSSAYINGEKNLDVQLDYNENGVLRNYSVII